MALTMLDIVENIENLTVFGATNKQVYRTAVWTDSQIIDPNTFYLLPTGELRPKRADITLAVLPEEEIPAVKERIQELLNTDYCLSVKLLQLHAFVMQDASAEEVAELCRDIMGNPVWLMNAGMGAIAYAGADKKMSSSFSVRRYITRIGAKAEIVRADEQCPYDRIASGIYGKNKVIGFILVLGIDHPMTGCFETRYMREICKILTNWEFLRNLRNNSDLEAEFVGSLLDGRLTDPMVVQQHQEQLKWSRSEKYYVLAVDCGPGEHFFSIQEELKKAVRQNIYLYGRYYVAIIGCKKEKKLERNHFLELLKFLNRYHASAGLSNGYSDLSKTWIAMEQSLDSMKLRSLFADKRSVFVRYEDRLLPHFFQLAEERGESLLAFCEPTVLSLLECDRDNGTEYFKTLATFVLNQMKLKETSRQLYVHRNTVYKRIVQLKEQYGFQFDDAWEVAKLQISVLIIGYLRLADLSVLADQEQIARHIPEAGKKRDSGV